MFLKRITPTNFLVGSWIKGISKKFRLKISVSLHCLCSGHKFLETDLTFSASVLCFIPFVCLYM